MAIHSLVCLNYTLFYGQSDPVSFSYHIRSCFALVLDPVMGDNGELYVQPDVIPLYRELMKHAEAVTPNQFEAEYVHSFLQLHGIHFDTIALSP